MSVLEALYDQASTGLAVKDYKAVVTLFESARKEKRHIGPLGDYLWGVALLGEARAAEDSDTIKQLAEAALRRFSGAIKREGLAQLDRNSALRLPRYVLVSCNYEIAEAFRLYGDPVQAEESHREARELAIAFARLTRPPIQARSGGVGLDLPPITDDEFLRETLPVVEELDAAHQRAAADLEAIVNTKFAGRPFNELNDHQATVTRLRELLGRMEHRVECPTCHEPAVPICLPNSDKGRFQFSHGDGQNPDHDGGDRIPSLRLVGGARTLGTSPTTSAAASATPSARVVVGLSEADIAELIADGNHGEVLERFARARQHHGLDAIEPAFQAYQRAIGGVSEEEHPGWDINKKRFLVANLNACARALGAYLVVGEHHGLLNAGGEAGSFQLRRQRAGKTVYEGLGQGLPLLRLSPSTPE